MGKFLVGIKRASAFWARSAVLHIRLDFGNFSCPHVGVRVSFLMCILRDGLWLLRRDVSWSGWSLFVGRSNLLFLVAAVRGDSYFGVPCSAWGAVVQVGYDFLFELVVADCNFRELILCLVTQTFQFCVFWSEACSPLINSLSRPSCGGPVCYFSTEPTSWLPNTYVWEISCDTFRSW